MIDVWSQGAIVGSFFGFIGGYHLALRKYNKERDSINCYGKILEHNSN